MPTSTETLQENDPGAKERDKHARHCCLEPATAMGWNSVTGRKVERSCKVNMGEERPHHLKLTSEEPNQ